MASEVRDSFPEGFAIPLSPKVKNRIAKYVLFVRLTVHVNHYEKKRNALLKNQLEQLSNVVIRRCWICLRIIMPTLSTLALELLCVIYKRAKYSVCSSK